MPKITRFKLFATQNCELLRVFAILCTFTHFRDFWPPRISIFYSFYSFYTQNARNYTHFSVKIATEFNFKKVALKRLNFKLLTPKNDFFGLENCNFGQKMHVFIKIIQVWDPPAPHFAHSWFPPQNGQKTGAAALPFDVPISYPIRVIMAYS